MKANLQPNNLQYVFLLLTILITYWAYAPGLMGYFVLDDAATIQNNQHIHIDQLSFQSLKQAAFSHESMFKRPISMLSFAINYYFTGIDSYFFKLLNLIVHMINGIGLYLLTKLLLNSYSKKFNHPINTKLAVSISIAAAAAWMVHPLNLTNVLYIVQRMNSLSTTFIIYGLILYVYGRQRINENQHGILLVLLSIAVFTPLAALCKENGLLLPLYILALEVILFRFGTPSITSRRALYGVFGFFIFLPVFLFIGYVMMHPQWLSGAYSIRDFNMQERLMTESRALWFYLKLILIPNTAEMGIFHDDFAISRGLLNPISTLFSILGIVVLLVTSVVLRNKAPIVTFGILFFLVGHSMESTLIGLELVHEHRNYLPQYGILLIIFFYIFTLTGKVETTQTRQAIAAIVIVLLTFSTFTRASYWGHPIDLSLTELENHPESPRAHFEAARIYHILSKSKDNSKQQEYIGLAIKHFRKSAELDDADFNGLFGVLTLQSSVFGKIEEKDFQRLVEKLEKQKISAHTATNLGQLIHCTVKRTCNIPAAKMDKILHTVLNNPRLTGKIKGHVLHHISYYKFNIVGDFQSAIEHARQSINIAPNAAIPRISLINMLIAAEDIESAIVELNNFRDHDKWDLHRAIILNFQNKISKLAEK